MKKNIILFIGLLILLPVLSLHFFNENLIIPYTHIYIISSILFLFAAFLINKFSVSSKQIFFLIILSFLIKLSFINTEPVGSDDIYRYIWDGKVQSEGINPYKYKPSDNELKYLESEIVPSKVNFPNMRTIYFPLSQWIFYASYQIGGESFFGIKLFIFLAELALVLAFYLLLRHVRMDYKNILYYLFCPLSIFQFSVDAHLDAFGLPLLIFSLYFYFREKKIISAILLGLSFAIKPTGLVLLPVFFFFEKGVINKVRFMLILLLIFGIQFLPYIFNSNPFEAFIIFSRNWMFNGLIFNIFNNIVHDNQTARSITSVLMILSFLPVYFFNIDFKAKIYLSTILLILFSPCVHPWYFNWLLILLVFYYQRSGIYLCAMSSLTVITVYHYQTAGYWKDFMFVQLIEYIPAIVFLVLEFKTIFKNRKISLSQTNN